MTNRLGETIAAAYGAVPRCKAPLQHARDGEDWAVRMLSFVALLPFSLFIDCSGTVGCLHKGKVYATRLCEPRAHIWGGFFASFDADDFLAQKAKAHATCAMVESGEVPLWQKKGNDAADSFAKAGAQTRKLP